MAEDSSTTGAKSGTAGVVVDKNKSAEDYIKEVASLYIVPSLIRQKFPNLVKMIYETESMDQDEREYWLQIMPIMSEEQVVKLLDILKNEKEQLEKLDAEYDEEMARINAQKNRKIDEVKLKEKLTSIKKAETSSESDEKAKEAELLRQLEDL
jgi:hypothetical protein